MVLLAEAAVGLEVVEFGLRQSPSVESVRLGVGDRFGFAVGVMMVRMLFSGRDEFVVEVVFELIEFCWDRKRGA